MPTTTAFSLFFAQPDASITTEIKSTDWGACISRLLRKAGAVAKARKTAKGHEIEKKVLAKGRKIVSKVMSATRASTKSAKRKTASRSR